VTNPLALSALTQPIYWILTILPPIPLLQEGSRRRAPRRVDSLLSRNARERSYLFDSGGNLMKQLLVAVAIVSLATTGCVNTSQFAHNNCGPACQVARSRSAPRPDIVRTVSFEGGLFGDMLGKRNKSCDSCCGACDCTCGYPEDCCCDASCGCADGCCDASCGCDSGGCCGDSGCGPCQTAIGKLASGFCPHSNGYPEAYNFNPGPPVGQTAYPYYTTRGPRDFLQNNPPTIGPH